MARRQCVFGGKLDVASVAVAERPLLFVSMTAKTGGHLGTEHLGSLHADFHVTANAFPAHLRHMSAMREPQVLARELGLGAHVGFTMTMAAGAFVVRLAVAAKAIGGGRKMHRRFGVGTDARVASQAIDAFVDMRAVFERARGRTSGPENACARRDGD